MQDIREGIINQTFPQFIKTFMTTLYPDKDYPQWACDALKSVNVTLETAEEQQ